MNKISEIFDIRYELRYQKCSSIYKKQLAAIAIYWRRSSIVTEINEDGCPPPIGRLVL
jgi:uncharacterized membrane-anchored protein